MNSLNIHHISPIAKAEDIFSAFDQMHIEWHAIDQVCWPKEYPYTPGAQFAIAHDDNNIYIAYKVMEKCIRALAADGGEVWKDSCCELFISPDDKGYYNIECNCTGHPLVAFGPDRNHRKAATLQTIAQIERYTTLGNKPFDLRKGYFSWSMALRIPTTVFFNHHELKLQGNMRGNIYKCGDETIPHFLAWNKVETSTPDFHQPTFFGDFHFIK